MVEDLKRELFYTEHFKALERDFPNFKFYIALSEPLEEDNWKVKEGLDGEGDGFIGFVHQTVIDNYLNHHDSPEDIEVYFCGPPLMNQAIEKNDDFGVRQKMSDLTTLEDNLLPIPLNDSELHSLAMNIVGKELEKNSFEFLSINSSLKKKSTIRMYKKQNVLYFVIVKVVLYPNNPKHFRLKI